MIVNGTPERKENSLIEEEMEREILEMNEKLLKGQMKTEN
jgi:hypothetical protein